MQVMPVKFPPQRPAVASAQQVLLPSPSLLPSVETVNDGRFHSVELVMLNQTLNLVVDKGTPKSLGKLQKQPAVGINSPLYLGGKALPPIPPPPPAFCAQAPAPRAPGWGSPALVLSPTPKANQRGLPGGVTTKLISKG